MAELCRLEIPGFTRAEFLDLKGSMPEGTIEAQEPKRSSGELGALDPITASIIVTLGLASITTLATWLLKDKHDHVFRVVRELTDGTREEVEIHVTSATSNAEVIEALVSNMPKPPSLPGLADQ